MPSGWKLGTIGDAVASIRGGFSVNCEDREAGPNEFAVLKTGAVLNGSFDPSQQKFVPDNEHVRLRTPVTEGTIIFCRKNSEDVIGASALAKASHPRIFLSDLLWEITPKADVSNIWLLNLIQSDRIRRIVRTQATGTQSSMKNISQDRLSNIPIAIPPPLEQQKIAEILQIWDEAIEKTARLIGAKEKRFAQAARSFFLPCHPTSQRKENDWHEFELGAVFKERVESGTAEDRLLSITMSEGVIDREEVGRKDTSNDDKSKYKLILPGDIGYNTMRMWQGVSGLSALRGIVSPAYTIVTPDNVNIDAHYAAHLFKSRRMVFDFERYSQGLTSDTWNLKFPAFSEIKVFLPPIEQQRKQAALLDAIRNEVAVMRKQKDSLSRQKRGLMQKLLTGEWRVNANGTGATNA